MIHNALSPGLRAALSAHNTPLGVPPVFLADFAGTESLVPSKGSGLSITRSGGATRVGPTGLVEFAPENLFEQSEQLKSSVGTIGNSGSIIDIGSGGLFGGYTQFYRISASGWQGRYLRGGTDLPAGTYTIRAWVRKPLGGADAAYGKWIWNGGSYTMTAGSMTTEWQQYTTTFTTTAAGALSLQTENGAIGTGFDICGVEVFRSPAARTPQIVTSGSTYYSPRIDYDPVTLECRGLLLEGGATNLFPNGTVLDSSNSAVSGNAIGFPLSSAATTDPTGGNSAWKVIENTSANGHFAYFTSNFTNGAYYTASYFVKANGRDTVAMSFGGGGAWTGGNGATCRFDLVAKTAEWTGAAGINKSITEYPNGWFRVSVTVQRTGPTGSSYFTVGLRDSGGNSFYTGDGVSGVDVFGVQLESSQSLSSYIPTYGNTITRTADSARIIDPAFSSLWDTDGMSYLIEAEFPPNPTTSNLYLLSNGSLRRLVLGAYPGVGTASEVLSHWDGVALRNLKANVRLDSPFSFAGSLTAGEHRTSFDGASVVSQPHNGSLLSAMTYLSLFENSSGHLRKLALYNKSISDAKLQSLTT